jgi:histidinol-phosphate aminotransferase
MALIDDTHGGPDALGCAEFDFSTNANACGPCPAVLSAIVQADSVRYPDPSYTTLRLNLARWHGVDSQRVLLAGSASEFIFRMTSWAQRAGFKQVRLPQYSYGDYARAAKSHGISLVYGSDTAVDRAAKPLQLQWLCDPSSPLGQCDSPSEDHIEAGMTVVDMAYAPLRLERLDVVPQIDTVLNRVWQLWTPNKALGLTGVRAAYAIAPVDQEFTAAQLNALCPSWPIGSHGVAMLQAWTAADTQAWLVDSLQVLQRWKLRQIALCASLGWDCYPSQTNFYMARPRSVLSLPNLVQLRKLGFKLRDGTSFGLAGQVRLSVQPPTAQDALVQAVGTLRKQHAS